MIFPCPNKIICPGTDSPVINFSSEQADAPTFIGLTWGQQGLGICETITTQEEADLCSARDLCITNVAPRFFNRAQTGVAFCEDGAPFSITVPAGLFCASRQDLADALALSYAQGLAQKRRFCLGLPIGLPPLTEGDTQCVQITCSGNCPQGQVQYVLISGALPPGMVLAPNGAICGTPGPGGTPGTYVFGVKGTNPNGDFMVKVLSLTYQNKKPACPDPGTCAPGTCWNTSTCACVGFGNDAFAGSLACPCDGAINVSGAIQKCTFTSPNAADYPDKLNQQAQTALTALLLETMAAEGCSDVSISGSVITNNGPCPVTYTVFNPNGTFADPTFHNITVAAGTSIDWCVFIFGITGDHHFGTHYFDLGGPRSYFTC